MALVPADMENCNIKSRCLSGANEGVAYDPDAPCASGTFNELTCDCEIAECGATCSVNVKWTVIFDTYGASCNPTTASCFEFGGVPYSKTITGLVKGTTWEFITVEDEVPIIGTCSGKPSETPAIRYTKCVNGVPTETIERLGAPGCSVNTSSGKLVKSINNTSGTSIIGCAYKIESTSRPYDNTYDCLDCSGTLTNQTVGGLTTNTFDVTEADYATAYIDCSNLSNSCESACLVKTASGKSWHLAGWDNVTNCEPAGTPDSGQNFICPNNVTNPCNAYNRPDLRWYSSSGRLFDAPRTIA